ncbi:DUF2059 domain-containing protein [Sneathiella sp.]|jgi:hypothetical protein|uniref:DUF2059 domain-containing protein n=1 Tax=Sneathiella sp. TaxID=1964365 RepID=UPI0025E7EAD7|nr:DUF2059 domain-containing protein [Sneathiella sp.]|tara:strand:- start:121 stop:609 length:489 start_codon:yes stop_codon:yes gene_type:complete
MKLKSGLIAIGMIFTLGIGNVMADPAREKAVTELLEITRTAEQIKAVTIQSIRLFLDQGFRSHPDIAEEAKDRAYEIMVETLQENIDGLVDPLKKVYADTYSLEELNAMIDFYSSDIGQKVVEKTPVIAQQAVVIGSQWGMTVNRQVMERIHKDLADKGYKL